MIAASHLGSVCQWTAISCSLVLSFFFSRFLYLFFSLALCPLSLCALICFPLHLSRSPSFFALYLSRTLSLVLCMSLYRSLSFSLSLSLSVSLFHSYSVFCTHAYSHRHTLTQAHTHTLTQADTHSHRLTLRHTHTWNSILFA